MTLKVTIMGCGNSTGVPSIGNYWGACDPSESKNRRLRSSVLIQSETTDLVIDTGPDFREQLNRTDVSKIDAVLYTHTHSDHVMGIDELRVLRFRNKELVPIYGSHETISEIKERFSYLLEGGKIDLYPPILQAIEIKKKAFGKPFKIGDTEIIPFEQDHGSCTTTGYRFGDFAYSLDFVNMDEAAVKTLKGIKTWVVDSAGYYQEDNIVHANLQKIYDLNNQIGAQYVYLSSLTLSMDYQSLIDELPEGFLPAYDGLTVWAKP